MSALPVSPSVLHRADHHRAERAQRPLLTLAVPSERAAARDAAASAARPHPLAPRNRVQAYRRRLAVLLVLSSLLALAVIAVTARVVAVPAPTPVSTATVVVEPGQTLWEVATEHAPPGTSPAAYVDRLVTLNGLDGGSVGAWQVLLLPAA